MAIFHEAVLPSGRAVRFVPITTDVFLESQDRAVERVQGTPEQMQTAAYQHKIGRWQSTESIALCLRGITASLPWKVRQVESKGPDGETVSVEVPDPGAMLDAVEAKDWRPLNYMALMEKGGANSVPVLFEDLTDYLAMVHYLNDSMAPGKDVRVFAGKARRLSE